MSFWVITQDLFANFAQNGLIFLLTLLGAVPLGLLITFGSMSRFAPIKYITKTFVWIIRGTPLVLQLFVVMYVPGLVFNTPMSSRLTAVLIAFIINYAAYFSEIYRGGIESIPKGQYEAGQVLGMTKGQIFTRVVLFQVIKRIVPPMGNEIITLVKDTSLARVIAYSEIIMAAERYTAKGIIQDHRKKCKHYLFGYLEKKLDYYKG